MINAGAPAATLRQFEGGGTRKYRKTGNCLTYSAVDAGGRAEKRNERRKREDLLCDHQLAYKGGGEGGVKLEKGTILRKGRFKGRREPLDAF